MKKIIIQILLQILISLPVYLAAFLVLGKNIKAGTFLEIGITLILFILVLILTLLILKNKILPTEIDDFSKKLGIAPLGIGIATFLMDGGILQIIYSPIAFFVSKFFLKSQQKV